MSYRVLAFAVAAVLSVMALVVGAGGTGPARVEIELFWDDGSAEAGVTSLAGRKIVVGFYAPETALTVTGFRIYIMDDGYEDPDDPYQPTTAPFTAWLLRTDAQGEPGPPGNDGYMPFAGYGLCPEGTWVEIAFPESIDVSNEVHFPNHKFYVGLEFEYRDNPIIGLDLDPPFSGETRYWDWNTWAPVDTANAMVRAVVCDTTGVPVELESWGRIKSDYR